MERTAVPDLVGFAFFSLFAGTFLRVVITFFTNPIAVFHQPGSFDKTSERPVTFAGYVGVLSNLVLIGQGVPLVLMTAWFCIGTGNIGMS